MAINFSRRSVIISAVCHAMSSVQAAPLNCELPDELEYSSKPADKFLQTSCKSRALGGPPQLSRFADPIYFLLTPLTWTAEPDTSVGLRSVTVPKGFVTDLASIPEALFSVLRADGPYATAAIVHDFLYWDQKTSREDADLVFQAAMRDLEVIPAQIHTLYQGVKTFGGRAWEKNKSDKNSGEKRILKKFPASAKTRWAQWKVHNDVFY